MRVGGCLGPISRGLPPPCRGKEFSPPSLPLPAHSSVCRPSPRCRHLPQLQTLRFACSILLNTLSRAHPLTQCLPTVLPHLASVQMVPRSLRHTLLLPAALLCDQALPAAHSSPHPRSLSCDTSDPSLPADAPCSAWCLNTLSLDVHLPPASSSPGLSQDTSENVSVPGGPGHSHRSALWAPTAAAGGSASPGP